MSNRPSSRSRAGHAGGEGPDEPCDPCDRGECCAISRNVCRPVAPRPSLQDISAAWHDPRRGRIARTVDAAVGWLRDVLRNAVRGVVHAVEDHPFAAGAVVLLLIGGAYIVAPAATVALLKSAAATVAAHIGTAVKAEVLASFSV